MSTEAADLDANDAVEMTERIWGRNVRSLMPLLATPPRANLTGRSQTALSSPGHMRHRTAQRHQVDDADAAAGTSKHGRSTAVQASALQRKNSNLVVSNSETDFLPLSSTLSAAGDPSSSDSDSEDSPPPSPPNTPSPELDVRQTQHHHHHHHRHHQHHHLLVLGFDITHLKPRSQFIVCAMGVFVFSLLYGFLQELISVRIFNRKLGVFVAFAQFLGYTVWSYFFRTYVQSKIKQKSAAMAKLSNRDVAVPSGATSTDNSHTSVVHSGKASEVPLQKYIFLSILRAIDLCMTNVAMGYVNYPAKTLMKSSRVVFTMIFGVVVARKRYRLADYAVVALMVSGLALFMHADASSSAVFQPLGIVMLTVSLLCDGAISNMSEGLMNEYAVGQDEFIFRLYSISLAAIMALAAIRGDLVAGIKFMLTPGTLEEIQENSEPTWSVSSKCFVVALFSTMGFLGSSCSAAITKHFGALTMSITSTARKAMTLFLSFALFNNVCTSEHIAGIVLFITSLIAKSLRASRGHGKRTPPSSAGSTSVAEGFSPSRRGRGRGFLEHGRVEHIV